MKIICIGRNYTDHIEELANERPEDPVVFLKPDTSLVLKNQPFFIPPFSNDVHYEVEILVRINRIGKHIQQKFAHKYYDAIGLGIDFTARDLQAKLKSKGLPWEKAKAFDGAAVVGDWVNKSELPHVDELQFEMSKNGTIVQQSSSALMLWKVDELIAYVSQFFTLKIGDIIFTGTPAGVGPVVENDVLEGSLEGRQLFSIKVK
ncbi:fumarylacetoacetate hydrolase family protein [Flavobacteriaceae bacterium]|nr:fumarylacetoacetate hydrolase family protein [Flavobacteriaceae bacterium]